jgi:hypothetical protein
MITKLTPEQEAELPNYVTKWIDMAAKPTDKVAAMAAVKKMYTRMGEKEPLIVFGDSPYQTALLAALFSTMLDKPLKKGDQLYDQLYGQLGDQLYDQLYGQLGGQLGGQLRDQLYGQLGDQLRDQLYDQLRDQLGDQLRGQLRDQLGDQLYDQLRGQLGNQLYDQLGGQLGDQLYDQLRGQLRDQLGDQLYDQLRGQLRDQLGDQLYDQLRGQLRDQLRGQLGYIANSLNNWNNLTVWWVAYTGWFDYGQYIGVNFDKELYETFMAFVSNVGFIIPYKDIAFISEAPERITWNNRLLSYDHDKAVKYKDGWGLYCLDGVRFTKDEWTKIVNQEFTLGGLIKADMGADKSAVAMKYLRPDRLLEGMKAKLIDTGRKGTRLYQVDEFTHKVTGGQKQGDTEYCIRMKHPSLDTEYIEWVEPKIGKQGSADLCQAKAFDVPLDQYLAAVEA